MSCADDWYTDEQLYLDLDSVDCDPEWQLDPLWWRMPWPVYRETAHATTGPSIDDYQPHAA